MFYNYGLNTNSVGLLHDGNVSDVVVPFDVEEGTQPSLMEVFGFFRSFCPGLAAVKQSEDDNRLVDHKVGVSAEIFADFLKTLL